MKNMQIHMNIITIIIIGYDPHVWLDPEKNKVFAIEIKDHLVAKDPKHKMNTRKISKN